MCYFVAALEMSLFEISGVCWDVSVSFPTCWVWFALRGQYLMQDARLWCSPWRCGTGAFKSVCFDVEHNLGLMLNGNNAYALLHMWIFFFPGTFCSFSLYLMHWIPLKELPALRCSSKWQKTIWSWELYPKIGSEKHFIFICPVSVFADWTLTLKPTVLRLVRLCDFYFIFFKLSPPPVIGRRCCILWRAPRFDSIVLQCGLSNRSSSVHCDVKDTSLFLLVLLFLSNHLLNTWEWTDVWGKVFHIIRKVGEEEIQRGNCFLGYAWRIIRILQERLHNMELSLKSLQTPNWTFIIYL